MRKLIPMTVCLGSLAVLSLLFLAGCNPTKVGGKDTTAKDKDTGKKEHAHSDTGPHGGVIVEWDDTYHAELTLDHAASTATVYILDDQAKKAANIDVAKITKVKLSITNVKPIVSIDLVHDAKKSGDSGIVFTGSHESFAKPAELRGTIDGTVDGKPYSGDFKYKPADKSKSAKLKEMYLQPGDVYTLADVKANGTTAHAEKFKGKVWDHDDNVKIGDKLCPITANKADKECAWIVQDQRYEFCCPPCLDKFIGWAHTQPEKIKDAKDYVFRGM